ncbi:MAG: SPOR domain-containing protein [Pseudomonadota bacterium]
MADFTYSPESGGSPYSVADQAGSTSWSNMLANMTNVAGAVVSLALIVGVGIWGYQLLVRDVSGIPVVRAAEGEMRVRPEDPGGQLARHQGLSVNEVAAVGTAAAPANELRLAPQPVDITEEDAAAPASQVASAPQESPAPTAPESEVPDVAAALQSGNVDDLVAQLTDGVTPLEALAPETTQETAPVIAELTPDPGAAAPQEAAAPAPTSGLRASLRPRKRPSAPAITTPAASAEAEFTSANTSAALDVDASTLPVGTRLAQLGAFDSEAVAREQWDAINSRFSIYMAGKKRVIQKASSGGRVFYRLRALGFEDIADARRFCSALVAENADCIPVVTR